MTVETAIYPTQLNTTLPTSSDFVAEGDDHLRLLKTVLKTTFPNLGGAWNATQAEANYIVGVTSPIQAQINSKGAITGQTWTGAHVFSGTATLPAATTIGAVTADELAHISGVTSPIQTQFAAKASLSGATYTGAHDFTGGALKAPTMTAGTATTDVATTAFVASAALAAALPGQTGNAGKVISTDGTNASWVNPVFLTPYANTATDTTAVPYGRYRLTASLNLTLPASPADGMWVGVVNTSGTTTARVLRNGQNINGRAEDLTLDKQWIALRFVFRAGYGWIIT